MPLLLHSVKTPGSFSQNSIRVALRSARLGVAVHADDPARPGPEKGARVAPGPERHVHDQSSAPEEIDHPLDQDGPVE